MFQFIAILALATLVLSQNVIGVPPESQNLYNASKDGKWRCLLDPSIVILESQINDNFCDCPDGSDEPGTNACEFTSENPQYFYCANDGYFPKFIENYKVNDGVCDYDLCCDGSDEYASGHCENKCAEVRRQYEEYMKQAETKLVKALKVKAELVSKAEQAKNKLTKKLAKIKKALKIDKEKLNELENNLKEAENASEEDPEEGSTSHSLLEELSKYMEEVENQFTRLSEFSSRNVKRIQQLESMLAELAKNYNPNFNDLSVKQCVKQFEEYISDRPQEEERPTTEKFKISMSDFAKKLNTLLPESYSQVSIIPSVGNMVHYYYTQLISSFKPIDTTISHPENRPKPKISSKAVNGIKEQIKKLQKKIKSQDAEVRVDEDKLEGNYGPDEILRAVEGEWVSKKIGEYTYKLGFLDAIYQDNTLIGRFASFDGESLHFTKGKKCWSGPQRSAIVETICGRANDIISVTEPEKCQYKFILQTPIACSALSREEIASRFKVDLTKL